MKSLSSFMNESKKLDAYDYLVNWLEDHMRINDLSKEELREMCNKAIDEIKA